MAIASRRGEKKVGGRTGGGRRGGEIRAERLRRTTRGKIRFRD